MKKIICICICICICIFLIFLSSGCGRLPNNGRPANDVVEGTGSEAKPPLPSNTPAPEPSNTPAPTPEPQSLSGTSDIGSSVLKIGLCVTAVILSVIGVYYGVYKPLYRFANFNPIHFCDAIPVEKKDITNDEGYLKDGYTECFFYGCHFYDCKTGRVIDEIPVRIVKRTNCYYQPNPSKLKSLLRKIFRIKSFTF